jgi:hypothetical protein
MSSTMICVAGEEVLSLIRSEKEARVNRSGFHGNYYDSESLCAFQSEMSRRGYIGAEIVKSIYGYGLRYSSGLQNFAIIAGARETGGTYEDAVRYATEWQQREPAQRYVEFRVFAEVAA